MYFYSYISLRSLLYLEIEDIGGTCLEVFFSFLFHRSAVLYVGR